MDLATGARLLALPTGGAAAVPSSALVLDRSRLRAVRDRAGRVFVVYVFGPDERPFRLDAARRVVRYAERHEPAGFVVCEAPRQIVA